MVLQAAERLEDHAGRLLEELLVADLEVQVHDLEVVVEAPGLALGAGVMRSKRLASRIWLKRQIALAAR
jgi:hypothetical protein